MMLQPHDRPVPVDLLLVADPVQRASSRSCCGSAASAATRRPGCSSSSLFVNVGMWLERFVIIVTSLHRDFLPSSWGMYYRHAVGLGDVHRHDRPVPVAVVPVHPRSCR